MTLSIGVIGPSAPDDFAHNIYEGLLELGIKATLLGPPDPPLATRLAPRLATVARLDYRIGPLLEHALISKVRKHQFDGLISVVSLRPETVRALQRLRVPIALWFPDHVANVGPLWMFESPYTAVFFKDPLLVDRLQRLLLSPVYYLPEACNPSIHRIINDHVSDPHVAVVGNVHPVRACLLERLIACNVPLKIYGNGRGMRGRPALQELYTGRYVRGLDKSRAFRSASCVLNNLHPAEISGMNCRLFEATAAGGAVVTEVRESLAEFYKPGEEVATFSTFDELMDHLLWFISNPAAGQLMGDRASARAHSDHSYKQRLEVLLSTLL